MSVARMTTSSLAETIAVEVVMSFLVTMSQNELHRPEVFQKIRDDRLSVVQAARSISVEVRSIGCCNRLRFT